MNWKKYKFPLKEDRQRKTIWDKHFQAAQLAQNEWEKPQYIRIYETTIGLYFKGIKEIRSVLPLSNKCCFLVQWRDIIVDKWTYQPYTLVGPPFWQLVLDPLAAHNSTTVYIYKNWYPHPLPLWQWNKIWQIFEVARLFVWSFTAKVSFI